MKNAIGYVCGGFTAGLMISLGSAVFLCCDNRYVGSLLFCVALYCICIKGYYLYTGRICSLVDDRSKDNISLVFLCLPGNLLGTVLPAFILKISNTKIADVALSLCNGKLEGQELWQTFVRAIFCGIIVYLAVSIFKEERHSPVAILLGIPAFILSGYEHSIADMFYFGASGIVSLKAFIFILVVIAGNSIGGMLLPFFVKIDKWAKS